MPPTESMAQRTLELREHLPGLSLPQAKLLAEWRYEVQAVHCCGQSQVIQFLATLLNQKVGGCASGCASGLGKKKLKRRVRTGATCCWSWRGMRPGLNKNLWC